ncbi:MAG: hypothetical protein R2795_07940 [Saprospiraceae bacterium]
MEEPGMQDVWLIRRPNSTAAYLDADNNPLNGFPAAGTRSTACNGQTNPQGYWTTLQSIGHWKYTQMIKVIDSTPPVVTPTAPAPFCTNATTCQGTATITFSVADGCAASPPSLMLAVDVNSTGQFTGSMTLGGAYPNYTATGTFPIGNHRLRIRANDFCGNVVTSFVDFSVVDCMATSLICTNVMSVNLMAQQPNVDADGDGDIDVAAVAINAELFVNQTGQDCTGHCVLRSIVLMN